MSSVSKKKTHHKHHKKNKNKSKEDPEETKEPAPAPATEETEKPVTEETEKPVKASDTVPEEKKKPTKSFLRDDTDAARVLKTGSMAWQEASTQDAVGWYHCVAPRLHRHLCQRYGSSQRDIGFSG